MTTKFQKLNGKEVTRKYLEQFIEEAKKENNTEVIYRLSKILLDNPNHTTFTIEVKNYPNSLNAPKHKGIYKEALTECGRLKKGWRFVKGRVIKAKIQAPKPKRKGLYGTTKPKEGLTSKGKLRKGYKYTKGGKIIKVNSTQKKKKNPLNNPKKTAENLPIEFLAGLEYIEADDNELNALNAPLTPNQIYQMITENVIKAITNSKGDPELEWDSDFLEKGGFLSPTSFDSKKPYRGVNIFQLKKGNPLGIFKNPYFLTLKQIEEQKGKLKKNAKAYKVVYFTCLYRFSDSKNKELFITYNKEKLLKFMKSKGYNIDLFDVFVKVVPILKCHEVFNGIDVQGIDFQLDNLTDIEKAKLGFIEPSKARNNDSKNLIAELIIKNFPKDSATIKHGYKGASYNFIQDVVKMPKYDAFYKSESYYSTLFHEMIHSTGHPKRLNRPFGARFGSSAYAKEELIAEFGAVFLSAQAGILWKTQESHAKYLKNWQLALKTMSKDNTLLMRSATQAQKAVDYLLQVDKNNEPKFYEEIKNIIQEKIPQKKINIKEAEQLSLALNRSEPKSLKQGKSLGYLNKNSLANRRKEREKQKFEVYDIQDKDLSVFLGDLEIKKKESLVITISGKYGSGKTHFLFRFMNILAQKYKIGHASLEEHPESTLYWDKADIYCNKKAQENIVNPEIKNLEDLHQLITETDITVIDSFSKLKELDKKIEIDSHLRKKYDGKLFVIVFQETTDNKMRGGSKNAHDGDCIFFTKKDGDYKNNYLYMDKNRYQKKPLNELQYNIYSGKLNPINSNSENIQEMVF